MDEILCNTLISILINVLKADELDIGNVKRLSQFYKLYLHRYTDFFFFLLDFLT